MYRSGCWWKWDLTGNLTCSHWTLLIQGAEPCTGFQVTHSSSDTAIANDMSHVAVQLPDVTRQAHAQKKQRNAGVAAEGRQAWMVQLPASGIVRLWIDGSGEAVEATAEVCIFALALCESSQFLALLWCVSPIMHNGLKATSMAFACTARSIGFGNPHWEALDEALEAIMLQGMLQIVAVLHRQTQMPHRSSLYAYADLI